MLFSHSCMLGQVVTLSYDPRVNKRETNAPPTFRAKDPEYSPLSTSPLA